MSPSPKQIVPPSYTTGQDPADTLFSRMIRGEIPCHRVYEDDHVIAILDINPLAAGHTLVIPKEPAATMGELSDTAASALGRVLPRISRAVCAAVGAEQYNLVQNNGPIAGQSVYHVHVHIIPRFENRPHAGGVELVWDASPADPEALADLGRHIARLL